MQLGRTVAELEQALSWRELMGWNDFFSDRADEQKRAQEKGQDEPPVDLGGLSPQQVAAAFGAKEVSRRSDA